MKHSFPSVLFFLGLFIAYVPCTHAQNETFEMVIQSSHTGEVASVDFAPDGKTFITASHDRTVRLWSRDGRLMRIFTAEEPLWSARFSPDGKHIIAAGSGNLIHVWNVLGKLENIFETDQGPITDIQFAPDGQRFAFGNHDDVVLGNLDGTFEKALEGHRGLVLGVAFSPDGLLIASCSEDKTVRIWNCFGDSVGIIRNFSNKVSHVIFSPDGTSIFTSGFDPVIREWSLEGKLLRAFYGHRDNVYAVTISPDSRFVISGGYDRALRLWSRDGKLLRTFETMHREAISDVRFSPDGKDIISASFDKSAIIWKIDGTWVRTLGNTYKPGEGGHWVQSAVFTPDGQHMIAAHWDERIVVWNTIGGIRCRVRTPSKIISSLDVAPLGNFFAVGTGDGYVHIYNLDGFLQMTFNAQSPVDCIAFTSDGERLLSGGFDQRISVWNLKTKMRERTFGPTKDRVNSIAVSPDGKSVVTGSNFGEVKLWDMDGTARKTFSGHGDYGMIVSTRYASNGRYFASLSVNDQRSLIVRDLSGATVLDIPTAHNKNFGAVAFSPDGRYIACTVDDKVQLFRFDGTLSKTFAGHTGYVNTLTFSSDSKHLLSGGDDGSIRLWHVGSLESAVYVSDDEEWVMFTPEGFFDASLGGGKFTAMVQGMNAFSMDQFASVNNRPDLILERLDIGDETLRRHYEAQFLKRVRMAQEPPAFTAAPSATIDSCRIEEDKAILTTTLVSSSAALRSYQIYVNNVPLFDAPGGQLSGYHTTTCDTIHLTPGLNKIEISCVDAMNVESLRAWQQVSCTKPSASELYFLGFGVSHYRDTMLSLQYADKDVKDLAGTFEKMNAGPFARVHTRLFIDDSASTASLSLATNFLNKAKENDVVILFIAGHGLHDESPDATYYFLPYEADRDALTTTAIPFDAFEQLLHRTKARRKLFFMDTCESGEADEGRGAISSLNTTKTIRSRAARGFKSSSGQRSYLFQKDRYIYNNLLRRSGTIVFSSSLGGEYSYERDDFQNGLFTEALIAALGGAADANYDAKVDTYELRRYLRKTVSSWSNGMQNPTV
ncbi:MAG TPA: caspase family protein, partial [bacterium]|nr:caspase family protein [bacterium]